MNDEREWREFLADQRIRGRVAVIRQAEAARRRLGLPDGWAERIDVARDRRFKQERIRLAAQMRMDAALGLRVLRVAGWSPLFPGSIA